MAEHATGARCFCCFDEGAGTPCGCQCRTLFACPACLWRLVAPPGPPGETPRRANTRCTVCRGRFADAAVLRACRHAAAGGGARLDVMETLLQLDDADGALALARGVVAEQEAALGAQHLTAVHFRLLLAYVLSRFGRDAEAVRVFDACARAQAAQVLSWDAAAPSASDRKWMHRTMRSRLNAAIHRLAEAEKAEGLVAGAAARAARAAATQEVVRGLGETQAVLLRLLGHEHRDVLAATFMLANELGERVLQRLGGAPARTRGQRSVLAAACSALDDGLASVGAALASAPAGEGAPLQVALEQMLELRAALAQAGGAAGPA